MKDLPGAGANSVTQLQTLTDQGLFTHENGKFHSKFRETVRAAGEFNEFRHPLDAGYLRLVPLLEIDSWPARQLPPRLPHHRQFTFQPVDQCHGPGLATHQPAEHEDHLQYSRDAALIEDMDRDSKPYQISGDIGLQI